MIDKKSNDGSSNLKLIFDNGATANVIQNKYKFLLRNTTKSGSVFKTMNGVLKSGSSYSGKLGILTGITTDGSFNLISPQTILEAINESKKSHSFRQVFEKGNHRVDLYRNGEKLFEFARSLSRKKLLILTKKAIEFLQILPSHKALATAELRQKEIRTPRNTQSTDWKMENTVRNISRKLGSISHDKLKSIIDKNQVMGIDLTEQQIRDAKKVLDPGFLRINGGIIKGPKSRRLQIKSPPLTTWMFDQLCHKTTGRGGETHCTMFYPTGEFNYLIAYCHRGLKCMPLIVNLWINKVKQLRRKLDLNCGEIMLIDNQTYRREKDTEKQVGVKVLYGDAHLANSSKALLEVVTKAGARVHLFPTDRRNALHELDNAMNRVERIAAASLMYAKLGQEFWPDAMKDAVYRFNRLPGKNDKKSAFEMLWEVPPSIKEFYPEFGSTAVIPRGDGKGGTMEAIFMYKRSDASACFYCPKLNMDCVRANYQIVEGQIPDDRMIRMWLGQTVIEPSEETIVPTFRHSKNQNCKVYQLYLKNHPFQVSFDDLNTVVNFQCGKCDFRTTTMRGFKTHVTTVHLKGENKPSRAENEIHKGRVAVHQAPRLPFEVAIPRNYDLISPMEADRVGKVATYVPLQSERDMDGEPPDDNQMRSCLKRKKEQNEPNKNIEKKKRVTFSADTKTSSVEKQWKNNKRHWKQRIKSSNAIRRSKRTPKPNSKYSDKIYSAKVCEEAEEPEIFESNSSFEKKKYVTSESHLLAVTTERDLVEMEELAKDLTRNKEDIPLAKLMEQKCKVEPSHIVKDSRKNVSIKDKAREAKRKVDRIVAEAKAFEKHIGNPPGRKRRRNELPEWVDPLEADDCISRDGTYPKFEPRYALLTKVLEEVSKTNSYDPEKIEFTEKDNLNWEDGIEEESVDPVNLDSELAQFSKKDEAQADKVSKNINRANVKDWEPKNIKRATNGPLRVKWVKAIQKELDNINGKMSFSLLQELSDDHVVLRTQWVFKIVINEDDSLKFKARLVLRGDLQKKDSIPPHTESPVVESLSINIVLAIAGMFGLACHTADIDGAYLTAEFKGNGLPVAIAVPQGCCTANGKRYLSLNRNLYGSVQGAAVFFSKLVQVMVTCLGYVQSNYDPCIMFKEIDGYLIIMAVYVDDLIILCKPEVFERVMKEIIKDPITGKGHFKMKHYGRVPRFGTGWKYYLGRQLSQCYETFTIYVSQSDKIVAAATNILKNLTVKKQHQPVRDEDIRALKNDTLPNGMAEQIRRNIQIRANIPYFYGISKVTNEMVTNFMRMTVGILGYLGMTGVPEIITVTNMLARYIINPSYLIVKVANGVFKYLYTKRDNVCVFGDNGSVLKEYILWGFSDASYGDVEEGMRSTAGHCIFLFGNLIAAKSYVIKSVCRSVTEAEIKAMSEATSYLEFIRNWMQDEIIPRLKKVPEASKFNLNCVKQTPLAYREKPFTLTRLRDEIREQPQLMSLLGYDNSASQQSVVNKFYKKKLRHVRIHASYIHYAFHVQKSIVVVKMPTSIIPSDLFTKLFGRQAHERLTRIVRNRMEPKDVRSFQERTYKYDFPRVGTNESLIISNDENVDRLLALLAEEEDALLSIEESQKSN